MIAFFEKTWFLWWLLAGVVIVRWFHGVAVVDPRDGHDSPKHEQNQRKAPSQLASRT